MSGAFEEVPRSPLQSQPDKDDYSKNSAHCAQNIESQSNNSDQISSDEADELLADLNLDVVQEDDCRDLTTEEIEEMMSAVFQDNDNEASSAHDRSENVSQSDAERSKNVQSQAPKWSKNVPDHRSKNVPRKKRRGTLKDSAIIGKIRRYDASLNARSLVGSPDTPDQTTSNALTHQDQTPSTADNDNDLPVWDHTGDAVKLVAATYALQLEETGAVAFTFNLTPKTIESAKIASAGFLDALKRDFDRELKRAFDGDVPPYWFAVDIDKEGRLHLHGAFSPPNNSQPVLDKIRDTMKRAWGRWDGPGTNKQVLFKPLFSDQWATYCVRNERRVAKIIGQRVCTINQPLRREARWAYEETRRIMRSGGS